MEGKKNDIDKARMELIPPAVLDALADVLTHGAKKYGDHNWAAGLAWSRMYGATMRHLNSWNAGENNDPESGKSHLWHALCEIAFLVASEKHGFGTDDRHPWLRSRSVKEILDSAIQITPSFPTIDENGEGSCSDKDCTVAACVRYRNKPPSPRFALLCTFPSCTSRPIRPHCIHERLLTQPCGACEASEPNAKSEKAR